MNEDFISFVWKYRLYRSDLKTTSGIPVTVLRPGEQHSNAGPDFFNARIRIGDTLWAGNVEIHVKSSDWYRHMHQHDKAYDNVVLHVVHEADSDIIRSDLTTIPAVALKNYVDESVLKLYSGLRTSKMFIPCSPYLHSVDKFILSSWMDRMLVERLEVKSVQIAQALEVNKNNWEDAFYQVLARNFGFHVNALPFEMLARVLPRNMLLRHSGQPHQVEALVFGQAGLLGNEWRDAFPELLRKEYEFLAAKYGILPLDGHVWKMLRMRPSNFPAIRLSQFASLVAQEKFGFSTILEAEQIESILNLIQVNASPYWSNHFTFDKVTRHRQWQLGIGSARNIMINTIIPCLFYYGKSNGKELQCEKAFEWLKTIPSESNHVLDEWKRCGITPADAYTGQALMGLYKTYCSEKKCLNCSLGMHILNQTHEITG